MPRENEEIPSRTNRITTSEIIITTVALLLRLSVMLAILHAKPATWFYTQASELGETARSVASGSGLASPFGGDTGPSAFLPPGYPLLVGGLFKLFGSYSRGAEIALLGLQAVFGTSAVLLLMILGRRMFGKTTAVVAGAVLAVDPWIISLGFVFWDTSLSLMLLISLVLVSACWVYRPSQQLAYAASLLGALAIAVNASLALTTVALFVWAVYRRSESYKVAVLPAVLFIMLCSIWPLRNESKMHAFVPLRDNLGYELWQGNRPTGDGFFDPELHPNTNRFELLQFQKLGELGYMRRKSAQARQFIAEHPGTFLRLTAKRFGCFWLGISRQRYLNQVLVATLFSFLGLFGLVLFIHKRSLQDAIPFIIPLALFPIPYYVTHPDFRFWCLLSPLLTALAVYTFVNKAVVQSTD